MARRLAPEEKKLWTAVAATVRPLPGRAAPKEDAAEPTAARDPLASPAHIPPPAPVAKPAGRRPPPSPDPIEPKRKRGIERRQGALEATLDLHGYDQVRAEKALRAFLFRAYDDGLRAALVITGRGVQGTGIIRRHTPDWLAAPDLRHIVAGFSEAHQKHGGQGALYVALKRRPME